MINNHKTIKSAVIECVDDICHHFKDCVPAKKGILKKKKISFSEISKNQSLKNTV